MTDQKSSLARFIDENSGEIIAMADEIFDNPETGGNEHFASGLLCGYLEKNGFSVERCAGGMETAFRAVYDNGGGPSIGLLCEYDALEGAGHACAHHMQGPAIAAAAVAVKRICAGHPFKLVVYGTPDEEKNGGKITMKANGCFRDIDVALMTHGSSTTTVDVKCLALKSYIVTFRGRPSHAAIAPELGRSALDALLLAFHGVEFLREHVRDDTRLHYGVLNGGGPSNMIPGEASGEFVARSYSTEYAIEVSERLMGIFKGAALMTETSFDTAELPFLMAKIPVLSLNDLLMKNAKLAGAQRVSPPRERTGSTDFGNVMYDVPGSCIRVAFVPESAPSHSLEYLDAGKSESAHSAVIAAAKTLAMTSWDLITDPENLRAIKEEFNAKKRGAV
jgi:amidohydrolase